MRGKLSLHKKVLAIFLGVVLWVILLAGCSQTAVQSAPIPTITGTSETVTAAEPTAVIITLPASSTSSTSSTQPGITNEPPPAPTAVPTRTTSPTPSTTPTPQATPTPTLPPVPAEVYVNGLSPEWFISMPEETIQRSREIFAVGQSLGRDGHRFSKIGDSIVDTEQFFTWFDSGQYNLGEYAYLEGVVDYYGGVYGRFGVALRDGLNSTAVLDPAWANKEYCLPNETPLACEIRLNNPSIILIHFGTNDWTGTFDGNMR
ncbi:MAG: hypothetical protein GY796_21800, partial [Chloroflexi bacterium]|nr:hypothetical protein [Chloroflexota bacterium]